MLSLPCYKSKGEERAGGGGGGGKVREGRERKRREGKGKRKIIIMQGDSSAWFLKTYITLVIIVFPDDKNFSVSASYGNSQTFIKCTVISLMISSRTGLMKARFLMENMDLIFTFQGVIKIPQINLNALCLHNGQSSEIIRLVYLKKILQV